MGNDTETTETTPELDNLGKIVSIEEVYGLAARPIGPLHGEGGARARFSQMLNSLSGHTSMEGFRVTTDSHELLILIDDESSCCESFGHVHSADDVGEFIGADLRSVRLTDTAINQTIIDRHGCGEYGFDGGGIQFVDMDTTKGKLQLAVYNAHNGYYGHGVVVALDKKVVHEDTI